MKNTILSISFVLISFALQAQKPDISYVSPQIYTINVAMQPRITAKNASGMDTTYLNLSIQALPTVQTKDVTSLTKSSAIANGNLVDLGVPNVLSYGVCWNKTGNPSITDSILKKDMTAVLGAFSFTLKNLEPVTTYYLRTFATSSLGTIYGSVVSFTTLGDKPIIAYNVPSQFSAGIEITPIKPVNTGGSPLSYGYFVSTFAGNGTASIGDGIGVGAGLNYPMGVAVDSAGYVYVVDRHNNRICKISPAGKVVTLAGSGLKGNADGQGKNASFNLPYGIDLDATGNAYVADRYNNKIRKITPDGVVTTFAGSGAVGSADGVGTSATFFWPTGVAVDSAGNIIIADTYNNKIRKITPAGVVTTVAGNGGTGTRDGGANNANFNVPSGVEVDGIGNIWVADVNNNMIRKISTDSIVTTVAGNGERSFADGTGRAAGFFFPYSLIMDTKGDFLVGDANNNRIRKVTKDGVVTTIAGNGAEACVDGLPAASSFNYPADVAYDAAGNIFVADAENHKIRKIAPKCYTITPTLPDGMMFDNLTGVISGKALKGCPETDYTIVAANAYGSDSAKFMLTILETPVLTTKPVSAILSTSAVGIGQFISVGYPCPTSHGICWSKTGIPTVDSTKVDKGAASLAGLYSAKLTNLLPNTHYIARAYTINTLGTIYGDTVSFNTAGPAPEISYPVSEQIMTADTTITPIILTNMGGEILPYNMVSTFVGNRSNGSFEGALILASFNKPNALAISTSGDIYVADTYNHRICQISPDGLVKTLAGTGAAGSTDGPAAAASFNMPTGVTVDKVGNVYVSDTYNNKIRKITKYGRVETIAGNGSQGFTNGTGINARFNHPSGIVIDSIGNLYISDYNNNKIRRIDTAGVVSTYAGSSWGSVDGIGEAAKFMVPASLAIDTLGNLYVVDKDANKVRKITPDRVVTTLAGSFISGSANGQGIKASFDSPTGIAVDSKGNIWVVDNGNNKIRIITPTGLVSTAAGTEYIDAIDGEPRVASFNNPFGIGIDSKNNVYVTEIVNNDIRLISNNNYKVSPKLPPGLKLDTQAGTLSGTPTTGSAMATYSVIASNAGGSDTALISIAVQGKPTTSTYYIQPSTRYSAYVQGRMLNLGYPTATIFGFCWNKTGDPVLTDSIEYSAPMGDGVFGADLDNLAPGTTYYVRAFATNTHGTSFGVVFPYTTSEIVPNIQYAGPQSYSVDTEIVPLIPTNKGGAPAAYHMVSTFSGTGVHGSVDGTLSNASYSFPSGIAFDVQGNMFIADAGSNKIRKISTDGTVSTFAGSGLSGSADGKGTAASFNAPRGLTVDAKGTIYIADTYNHKIRKISKEGDVTTMAGSGTSGNSLGIGIEASFNNPTGVAVDTSGNVYVADKNNHRICMISASGNVTTLAGCGLSGYLDGIGLNAYFNLPTGVAVDARGAVFVADYANNSIRKISKDSMVITIVEKRNGGSVNTRYYSPFAIVLDTIGNLYVTEHTYGIRKITPSGEVTTLAGQTLSYGYKDGLSTNALFNLPSGIAVDKAGMVYVADYVNKRIRKISPAYYSISPSLPTGMNFDALTGTISGKPTTNSVSKIYTIYSYNTGGTCNAQVSLSVLSTGLYGLETSMIAMYPNPASGQIQFKGLNGREMLSIYSLTGMKMLSKEISNGEIVDISNLKSGMFMVKVGGKDLKLVKK